MHFRTKSTSVLVLLLRDKLQTGEWTVLRAAVTRTRSVRFLRTRIVHDKFWPTQLSTLATS